MSAINTLLDRFIDSAPALRPAPRILPELLTLLCEDDTDAERVITLIQFDPALTASVLRLSNSVTLGSAEPVEDLSVAVSRLGFNQTYRLVARAVGEGTMKSAQRGYHIAEGELWRHAAVSAVAGQVLARELGQNENLAFTAALLHDIGKLLLSIAVESTYADVMRLIEESGQSFLEAEKATLGVDHAEVGGRLLERWGFPQNLVQAVRHHHDPLQAGPHQALAAGVHLSDVLAHLLGHGYGHHAYAVRTKPEALDLLKLKPGNIEDLLLETQNALSDLQILNPHQP